MKNSPFDEFSMTEQEKQLNDKCFQMKKPLEE